MIHPGWLALFYGSSEVLILTLRRSGNSSNDTDKGSLRTIWAVINVSMMCGIAAGIYLPSAQFGTDVSLYWIGFVVFVFGLALRWYSIAYLGRFFTVDVAVQSDQTVIDSGPYRLIRHPSYTGLLLAFYGLALCFANYITLFFLTVPVTAVLLYRMRIEEAALRAGLGESYRQYMNRTRRLIPYVY